MRRQAAGSCRLGSVRADMAVPCSDRGGTHTHTHTHTRAAVGSSGAHQEAASGGGGGAAFDGWS